MRGPLLSGAVGSAVTLQRLYEILEPRQPAVVLSALWLAEALARKLPLIVVIEPDKVRAARRLLKRQTGAGRPLLMMAAEHLPLTPQSIGAIVVEGLIDIEDDGDGAIFLAGLLPALRTDGVVVSLDATKQPAVEGRLGNLFLAAALTGIVQERPREGALLTIGRAPPPLVVAARVQAP